MKEFVILQSLQNAVDLEHSETYRAAFWQRPLEANILSLNDIFRDISLLSKWWIFTWYVPLPENASPDGKHSAFDYDIMMLPCCVGDPGHVDLTLWFIEVWIAEVSMACTLKKNVSFMQTSHVLLMTLFFFPFFFNSSRPCTLHSIHLLVVVFAMHPNAVLSQF